MPKNKAAEVAKSASNSEQLALLRELNSQVKSSVAYSRPEVIDESEDKAVVLDQDEAIGSFNDESADAALDNFLARAQSGTQEKLPDIVVDNFLKDDDQIEPIRKPQIKEKTPLNRLASIPISPPNLRTTPQTQATQKFIPTNAQNNRKKPSTTYHIASQDLDEVRKQLADREAEMVGLETQLGSAIGMKYSLESELAMLKKKNAQLEVEKVDLGKQLEVRQLALEEATMARKAAELDSQNKTRLLKERQELASRSYINTALENQRRVYEGEIEKRNLKIEMLEANLKAAEDKLKLT